MKFYKGVVHVYNGSRQTSPDTLPPTQITDHWRWHNMHKSLHYVHWLNALNISVWRHYLLLIIIMGSKHMKWKMVSWWLWHQLFILLSPSHIWYPWIFISPALNITFFTVVNNVEWQYITSLSPSHHTAHRACGLCYLIYDVVLLSLFFFLVSSLFPLIPSYFLLVFVLYCFLSSAPEAQSQ